MKVRQICKKKCLMGLSVLLTVIIFLVTALTFSAHAEMEIIKEWNNDTELTYIHFNGRASAESWDSTGKLEGSPGNWSLYSNGWAQWDLADNMDFAYQLIPFNYTSKTQLTVDITMTSFDGVHDCAGAGLMFRTSLDPGAETFQLHYRPKEVHVTYRLQAGGGCKTARKVNATTSVMYPVTFRAVATKGSTQVKCYYKVGNGNFMEFGSVPFSFSDKIYVGISSYSQQKDFMSKATFSHFNAKLEGPTGWKEIDSGEGEVPEPEEDLPTLPEDLPPPEDVLLRETFTDGSMIDEKESVTNPIWKIPSGFIPDIVYDDEKNNRYLNAYMESQSSYFAGDQHWTDYRLTMDLTFTKEYSFDAPNSLIVYVRHTDILLYNNRDYAVVFGCDPITKAQTVSIGGRDSKDKDAPTIYPGTSVSFNYLTDTDKKFKLTVDAFDNVIKVYIDDVLLTGYTDTGYWVRGKGNIGFSTNQAALFIDNIVVSKLPDLLGGDYDNTILGNWNEAPPEYLDEFAKNEWAY